MWDFYKRIGIVDENNKYTGTMAILSGCTTSTAGQGRHSVKRRRLRGRPAEDEEEVEARGVDLATGHGEQIWDLNPQLAAKVNELYDDAKKSLWAELTPEVHQLRPRRECRSAPNPRTATITSLIRAPGKH